MQKTIALHQDPHTINVGPYVLEFVPEQFGDEFVDAYAELNAVHQAKGVDLERLDDSDPDVLRQTLRSLRVFIARQMLPDSARSFLTVKVMKGAETLGSFQDVDEARALADQNPGSVLRDEVRLPTRAIVEILETTVEWYGGGNRPTGSSSGSAPRSRPGGSRGTGISRSRA
ncbi:hypothetical protein AQJ30_15410 [Streptomyces longwoodensis]|uniref:Uncharacterized protein n=1 Tax=Streptomyces longwoodensis TaxID=68231 RepID=A0A101QX60_9ACTN|nr:hypothetical protein [Streptomyces longwoodensis]KUN37670.1 hypothetical protein AQJ30_15410 [Streptomyces longwoodensis]